MVSCKGGFYIHSWWMAWFAIRLLGNISNGTFTSRRLSSTIPNYLANVWHIRTTPNTNDHRRGDYDCHQSSIQTNYICPLLPSCRSRSTHSKKSANNDRKQNKDTCKSGLQALYLHRHWIQHGGHSP